MNKEIWVQFCCTIGHKILLEVSSYGRRRTTNIKTGKITRLDFGTDSDGYKVFGGFGSGHRIIANVFIENPECKPEVTLSGQRTQKIYNMHMTQD